MSLLCRVVQFIDGMNVPVIMQRRCLFNSGGASDSVHRQSRGHSRCANRDWYTASSSVVYGGGEGVF